MTQYKMSRDYNGNKTVQVKVPGERAFSIQTNGNLPKTHRTNVSDEQEILDYVKTYGSLRQKRLMGF